MATEFQDLRITRRRMLGAAGGFVAGAAVPGSLLAPSPASATGPEELWSHPLGTLSGTSRPIVLQRPFALIGVRWQGAAAARVELRARLADGRWSRWGNASVSGHGPDRPRRTASNVGDPLWVGEATVVQVRTSVRLLDVRLELVSPPAVGGERALARERAVAQPGSAALPLAQPQLPTAAGQPPIIARAAWANGKAPPKVGPAYGDVRLAFVHHTDNLNGYSASQVPSIIYSIYVYHCHTRGWNDIGYNFVIDDFGRAWEAREGGIDLPVAGAQAGGYNLESTGIAMLGTFSDRLPSPEARETLARLLAWKLSLHGLPVHGQVKVEVDPADYFYTPFKPGQKIELPRIAGHRQGCSTDCPGNDLFEHLPAIRRRARALAPSAATIAMAVLEPTHGRVEPTCLELGGSKHRAGARQELLGQLLTLGSNEPIVDAAVELQEILPYGRERTLQTYTTNDEGFFGFELAPVHNTLLRALYRSAPATVSPLLELSVSPQVSLQVVSTAPLRVTGTVFPQQRHVTVQLLRHGKTKPLQEVRARVRNGSFVAALRKPRPGHYVLVARTEPSERNAAGRSKAVSLTV